MPNPFLNYLPYINLSSQNNFPGSCHFHLQTLQNPLASALLAKYWFKAYSFHFENHRLTFYGKERPDRFDGLHSNNNRTHWPEIKMTWLQRKIPKWLRNCLLRKFLICTGESSRDFELLLGLPPPKLQTPYPLVEVDGNMLLFPYGLQ